MSADVEALKAKHGDLYQYGEGLNAVICRRPTRASWKRFKAMAFDDKRKPEASETLFRDACVWPTGSELEALIDRVPAIVDAISVKLVDLLGVSEEIEEKKL